MTWQPEIDELQRREQLARDMGGPEKIAKHHSQGRMTVRSPFRTVENFGVEEIIDSRETRPRLCEWLRDAYVLLPPQLGRPSHGTRP